MDVKRAGLNSLGIGGTNVFAVGTAFGSNADSAEAVERIATRLRA